MMKINVILIAAVCFFAAGFTGFASAQTPVSFGIKGGVNLANFTDADDSEIRTGFNGGISMDLSLPGIPLGVESGAYYSQKGAESSLGGLNETVKLDYIEIPVLAKFNLGLPGPATPHLVLGPYAAFNVSAESEISGDGGSGTSDISDDVNDTEFGGMAGLGIDFNLGITRLNAQARYSLGFTPIFSEDSDNNYKNSVASLVVGIKF